MLRQCRQLLGAGYMKRRTGQQQSAVRCGKEGLESLTHGGAFKKAFSHGRAGRSPLFVPRAKLPPPRFVWHDGLIDETREGVLKQMRDETEYLNQQKIPKLCEGMAADEVKNWMEPGEWTKNSRRVGIIGKKIAVTNYWEKSTGNRRTCTLVQIPDNHVLRYFPRDEFNGKEAACIVGAGNGLGLMKNEIYNEYCRDAGVPIKSKCFRFRCTEDAAILPGTRLHVGHFRVGDFVDCRVKTVGYGHLDAMQRWHAGGGPALDRGGFKRTIGAVSTEGLASIPKGRKDAGKVGNEYREANGRRVLRINYKHQVMWVQGRMPGHLNQWIQLRDHMHLGKHRHPMVRKEREGRAPPPFPTDFLDLANSDNFPGETIDNQYFSWGSENITYK